MTSPVTLAPVQLPAQSLVLQAVTDGRRIGLQLANQPAVSRQLKKAGAWWFAPGRMWTMAHTQADRVLAMLHECAQGLHVDLDGARSLIEGAVASPQPDFFTQRLDAQVFPLVGDGPLCHAVSFEYDQPCMQAMRSLRGQYHPAAKAWRVQVPAAAVLQALQRLGGVASEFVFLHETPVVLEPMSAGASSGSPIVVPAARPEFGPGPAAGEARGNGFMSAQLDLAHRCQVDEEQLASIAQAAGLRSYQVHGVRHLVGQSGALLGDDMGLGKSRQTVVAMWMIAKAAGVGEDANGRPRILIVCPASLRINWQREIHAVFPDALIGQVGETKHEDLFGCDWVVANYERLGGLVRDPEMRFAVMAIDEAHYLKEHQAGRTRNAFIMAARIPRRYVVTGTPLLSREVELHTLLRMTGHELGVMSIKDFRKAYSGSADKRAALAERLRGWMLRRSKSVLSDLGTKTRQVVHVSPAEGLACYRQIYGDMTMQAMPKITVLRQRLETLKTAYLIESIQSLGEDDKAIVFCEYTDTVAVMQEAFASAGLACVTLVGSDSAAKRQRSIDAFQQDPKVRVFIGTTMAAGVGITLTAANYVFFASLPWTNALMRQAEDRAYRLGQKRNVIVVVPLIPTTLDEAVWKLLDSKAETEREVVEAVRVDLNL